MGNVGLDPKSGENESLTMRKILRSVPTRGNPRLADYLSVPMYPFRVMRKKQSLRFILLAVFAALLISHALPAQQPTSSPVVIQVTDPSGTRIPHALIRVVPAPDSPPAKMETNDKGELTLDLKTGGYALFVSSPGFKSSATHFDLRGAKEPQPVPIRLDIGAASSPTVYPESIKDTLRISANPYHEDVFLKPSEFKAMPHITVSVHNEHSQADETYSGVRLSDVLAKLNAPLGKELRGIALSCYVVASGSDGYAAVISLAEIDPAFHSGEVIVADTMNGAPIDPKSGPFKLVVTEDRRPARWVRNLVNIELRSAK